MIEKKTQILILDLDQMIQIRKILQDLLIFRTSETISVGTTCLSNIAKEKAKGLEMEVFEENEWE